MVWTSQTWTTAKEKTTSTCLGLAKDAGSPSCNLLSRMFTFVFAFCFPSLIISRTSKP